jgi:GT2 family glycosyltransferase
MGEGHVDPFFSVVVPTYDRHETLEQCVRGLAEQTWPRDRFEVLVVDDGSATPPRHIVERYAGVLDIRLVEAEHGGPAAARNHGAFAARGTHVVFTDDDCIPDREWLSALTATVCAHPEHAVGGAVINALPANVYSTASQILIEFLYEYFNGNIADGRFFVTSNLVFPADAFRAMRGFDVTFPLAAAEDRDMCDRWRDAGGRIEYCASAVVRHAHALTLGSFLAQHFNYGRGAHHLHRARARRGIPGLAIEPPRFYARLATYPLSKAKNRRAVVLSALLVLSQVAYAAGFFRERARHRPA